MKKGMAAKNIIFSQFYCTHCGKKGIDIPRKIGQAREDGHLKKLYCFNCKMETNHVECKSITPYSYEDFKLEYEYNNFTEDGLRIYTLKQLKSLIREEKIEKVRELK